MNFCFITIINDRFFFAGHKSFVLTHLNYLVIVTPPFTPTASSTSATVRNLVAANRTKVEEEVSKVSVFDLENKLIAHSGTFGEGVREVISQCGKIYVLGNDGNVSPLVTLPFSLFDVPG